MAARLVYLDSSVALRTILDVPDRKRLQAWMEAAGSTFVSSRLLRTEVIRALRRDGRPIADGRSLLDRVGLLEISRETHSVAESIERHIKTLDALHLATALLIGEPVTVATHDSAMKAVAEHVGLLVTDPVDHPESPIPSNTRTGSRLSERPQHRLRSAASVDDLLDDDRDH